MTWPSLSRASSTAIVIIPLGAGCRGPKAPAWWWLRGFPLGLGLGVLVLGLALGLGDQVNRALGGSCGLGHELGVLRQGPEPVLDVGGRLVELLVGLHAGLGLEHRGPHLGHQLLAGVDRVPPLATMREVGPRLAGQPRLVAGALRALVERRAVVALGGLELLAGGERDHSG